MTTWVSCLPTDVQFAGLVISLFGTAARRIRCWCHIIRGSYKLSLVHVDFVRRMFIAWCFKSLSTSLAVKCSERKINLDAYRFNSELCITNTMFFYCEIDSCLISSYKANSWCLNYEIQSYQVPVYIAEISPQNTRGALGSVNQVCLFSLVKSISSFVRQYMDWFMWSSLCYHYIVVCHHGYLPGICARHVCSLEVACCTR
jgi:hypothetical protein